jgi:tRNA pseudouridine13 synthase
MTSQTRKTGTAFPWTWTRYADLAHAYGGPVSCAVLRDRPQDFNVVEELGFKPTNEGQHVLLKIQKTGITTDMLAGLLAKFAGVAKREIGYAGLKDKRAVTTQWFSVNLAGRKEPDWMRFHDASYHVIDAVYNKKKIQRGALRANRFDITLRHVNGEHSAYEDRLELISRSGVPNYFAEQRFGRDEQNIDMGLRLLNGEFRMRDRYKRGIYYSAVRSCLFNMVLSDRVKRSSWNSALPGDTYMLSGTKRYFLSSEVTPDIMRRVECHDIHPTGPLHGEGKEEVSGAAAALENRLIQQYSGWCAALASHGLRNSRRALRLHAEDMTWQHGSNDTLSLQFALAPGGYATSVLRELVQYNAVQP